MRHGGIVDDGECTGTGGNSDGGRIRRVLLQHRRELQLSIGGLLAMMWRGERSRRIRERRGASSVWRRRCERGSIYSIEVRPRGASKVVDGDGCPGREGARRWGREVGDG
jgi:hypothetical protein